MCKDMNCWSMLMYTHTHIKMDILSCAYEIYRENKLSWFGHSPHSTIICHVELDSLQVQTQIFSQVISSLDCRP